LHLGDSILDQTTLKFNAQQWSGLSKIPEIENTINNTTLLPGQIINGSVVFSAGSLYERSFYLMYNTTPVDLSSFEKSMEALTIAELFNYSITVGKPPIMLVFLNSHPCMKRIPMILLNLIIIRKNQVLIPLYGHTGLTEALLNSLKNLTHRNCIAIAIDLNFQLYF